jgi:hypothetical protein
MPPDLERATGVKAKSAASQFVLEGPQRKALAQEAGNAIIIMMANNFSGF